LEDNVKARILDSKQNNEYRDATPGKKIRAQEEMYKIFKKQVN
jgi:hypothetical protein